MKTTKSVGYAIACLHELAKRLGEYVQVAEIAAAQQVPVAYCQKVLLLMSYAGLVESVKGRGFTLIKPFELISTLEVIRALNAESERKADEKRVEAEEVNLTQDRVSARINELLAKLTVAEVMMEAR